MQPGPSAPTTPADPTSTDPGRLDRRRGCCPAAARKARAGLRTRTWPGGTSTTRACRCSSTCSAAPARSASSPAARRGDPADDEPHRAAAGTQPGLITRTPAPGPTGVASTFTITTEGRRAALEAADVARAEQPLTDVLTGEQLADLRALLVVVVRHGGSAAPSQED